MVAAAPVRAQDEQTVPTEPYSVDDSYLSGLKWRNIGPDRGGRSIAVAGSAARPNEYFFGATGGGLWKTTDGGASWKPVTDGKADNGVVGGVAVCESNPDVVYFTTGETELRGNVQPGNGVFKSTDAGKTWTNVGLEKVRNFSRVRIAPRDCNSLFVAGFGHYGAPGADRGVYKSSDGGAHWRKVLYRDERSGAVDISIDPKDSRMVYASLWEAWRKPWGMSSGGPGSGLFKSVDGGEHWTELTSNPGMPAGPIGKIGVSVSPVDSTRIYALVEAKDGGMFVTDDSGATWRRTSDSRDIRQRAFYYTRLQADPKVKDRVYVLNVNFLRSDDGGKTFPTKIKVPHGDNHDLWIAPNDNQRMIEANDGGGTVSVNGGKSWTRENYPTAQIYRLTISNHFPYFVCGAQQDNSSICVPSKDWKHVNVLGGQYGFAVAGGESGYIANDPQDPNIFFAGSYGGALDRFDYSTGQTRSVNVLPDNPMGYSASDIGERFQWTYPIVFDPQDKGRLYASSQHVWQTLDQGQSWQRISPDLTRHDPATLGPSGGAVTLDQTGVETYSTVFALALSRLEPKVIWAGSDDGLVHVTRDDGRSWQNVTPAGLPPFLKITTIEDSPTRRGTAFLTGNRFLLDDLKPYLLRTDDYGQHWTSIADGLPADEIVRSVREDIVRPGLLYIGTERGVRVSFDDGRRWQSLQRELPAVQVSDLAVTDHDLVIATHGRSFWVLDNIDVIRQLGRPIAGTQGVRLFRPAPAVRGVDEGVILDYYLPRTPRSLTLDILDSRGQPVWHLIGAPEDPEKARKKKKEEEEGLGQSGGDDDEDETVPKPGMKAGLNRYTWDMNYPGYTEFKDMILWAAANHGPAALPGNYQVRLTVDGKIQTQTAQIRLDPRLGAVKPADLEARFALATQIRDQVSRANQAVLLARGIRRQIAAVLAKTEVPSLRLLAEAVDARVAAVEGEIYQVRNKSEQDPLNYPIMLDNKLAALMGVVESGEAAPTLQARSVFADLSARLDREIAELDRLLATDLPVLNAQLKRNRLPAIERRAEAAVEQGTANRKDEDDDR